MNLMDMLSGVMAGPQGHMIGQQLGLSDQQTQAAMTAAVPLLVNALAQNAEQPGGAHALSGALAQHNGEALDRLASGTLPDQTDGQRILGHMFGAQDTQAAQAVGRAAGINPQVAMSVLQFLAPIILGALSRRMGGASTGGSATLPGQGDAPFDPSVLGGVLGQERAHVQNQLPGLLGTLGRLVDRDGDGNPLDDLARMIGGR
ncbi:DUF937 domain-containing protein [Deinococcus maricopensis]|nr:DUF937 domain-containing protein [Deinococcus maricopensis]